MFGNHPYSPNLKKTDDNLKCPVNEVIERISDWGKYCIAVKKYNEFGMLERVDYYVQDNFDNHDQLDTSGLKRVKTEVHEYKSNNLLTSSQYLYFDLKGVTEYFEKNYYNEVDSLIAFVTRYVSGDSINIDSTNIEYAFNKDSVVITKKVDNDIVEQRTIFKDSLGICRKLLINKSKEACAKIIEYMYDEYGHTISFISSERTIDSLNDCDTYSKYNIVYNKSDKIILEEYVRKINDIRKIIIVHSYDKIGNGIRDYTVRYTNDRIEGFSDCLINEQNDYESCILFDYYYYKSPVQVSQENISVNYKYDLYGNWIEKMEYRNGKPDEHSHKIRVIQYY